MLNPTPHRGARLAYKWPPWPLRCVCYVCVWCDVSEYTQSILRVHAEYIYHFFIIHHDGKDTLRLSETSNNVLTCGVKYVCVVDALSLNFIIYSTKQKGPPL